MGGGVGGVQDGGEMGMGMVDYYEAGGGRGGYEDNQQDAMDAHSTIEAFSN